jgi:hypothetical protein
VDAADGDDQFNDPRVPDSDPFGPQTWRGDDIQWLPIARGSTGSGTKVR